MRALQVPVPAAHQVARAVGLRWTWGCCRSTPSPCKMVN